MEQEVLQIAQNMAWLAVTITSCLPSARLSITVLSGSIPHGADRNKPLPVWCQREYAAVRLKLTEHQFQQRGFAASIGPIRAILSPRRTWAEKSFTVAYRRPGSKRLPFRKRSYRRAGLFHLHLCGTHHFATFATPRRIAFRARTRPSLRVRRALSPGGSTPLPAPVCDRTRHFVFFHTQSFFFFQQVLVVIPWKVTSLPRSRSTMRVAILRINNGRGR